MQFGEDIIAEIEREVIETEERLILYGPPLPPEVQEDDERESEGEDLEDFEESAEEALEAAEEDPEQSRDDAHRTPSVVTRSTQVNKVWQEEGLAGFIRAYGAAVIDRDKTNYTFVHFEQIQQVLMEFELRPVMTQEQIETVLERDLGLPFVGSSLKRYDFYYVGEPIELRRRIAADDAQIRPSVLRS